MTRFAALVVGVLVACGSKSADPKRGASGYKPGRPPHPAILHRETAEVCPHERPPGRRGPATDGCKADSECTQGKNGRCNGHGGGHAIAVNECDYDACFTDADCGSGSLCLCGTSGNWCARALCRTDADCGEGGACSSSEGSYACHTADDACVNTDDCPRQSGYSTECAYSAELGHWACVSYERPVG
jgi:hypothetical protein